MRRKYIKYYNKLRLFLNVPLQYVKCSSIPSFPHLWPWRTDLCVALQLTDDPRHRTIRKGYRYNVLFYLFFLFTCLNFFYLLFFLNERLPPLPRVRIGWDVTMWKKSWTQRWPGKRSSRSSRSSRSIGKRDSFQGNWNLLLLCKNQFAPQVSIDNHVIETVIFYWNCANQLLIGTLSIKYWFVHVNR